MSATRSVRRTLVIATAASLVTLPLLAPTPLAAGAAGAAGAFVVDAVHDAVDVDPGDGACAAATGACTLRAAVQETNALAGPDTITVPAGSYTLSRFGPGENEAARGDLDVTDDVTVTGAGPAATAVDADGIDRVFHVAPGVSAAVEGVRLTGGSALDLTGGGVLNEGTLGLVDVVVADNHAPEGGGGITNTGTLSLTNAVVEDNTTVTIGGGIRSGGTLSVGDSVIRDNRSLGVAGGLAVLGTATLTGSFVHDNVAESAGTSGGSLGGGGIGVFPASEVNLISSEVVDNWTGGGGGGIGAFGTVRLVETTLAHNRADGPGGGIASTGTVEVVASTVAANEAGSSGGGISTAGGRVTLENATVSGNSSTVSGGGVNVPGSILTAVNATIAANVADSDDNGSGDGGGAFAAVSNLANTIVGDNVDRGGESPDCTTVVVSRGHNLIESSDRCLVTGDTTGNVIGQAPGLAPLADNGGPTHTHALVAGSPGVDAGNPVTPGGTTPACPARDQRGQARPQDGNGDGTRRCDIGAFEREGAVGEATAEPTGDTLLLDAFVSSVEVDPGLCLPGDTPACEGPTQAQFRVTSTDCTLAGVFEDQSIPAGTECFFDLTGVMEAVSPFEKPACGAIAFRTTGENVFEFGGIERTIHLEGETIGTAVSISGYLDGDDPDTDPVGDHEVNSAGVTRAQGEPGTLPCTTAPLTAAIFTGSAVFS